MDPEVNRNPQSYHLYLNERRFLLREGSGSRPAGEIRKRIINQRLPKLPNRIQDLINDVALLNNRDLLTASNWENGWMELKELSYPEELKESDVWLPNTNLTDFTKLGFVLGRLGRTLSKGVAPRYDSREFMWGFLLGAVGRPQGEYRTEQAEIRGVLKHLQEEFSRRKSAVNEQRGMMEKETLKEDVGYSDFAQLLSSGSNLREMRENALEERRNYRKGKKPGDTEDLELLNDNIDATPGELKAISELSKLVQQSARQVSELGWRGMDALDPLRTLYNEDSQLSSTEIAPKPNYDQLVTHLMRWLAGEKADYEWEYPPLIIKSQNTEGQRTWELTPFGRLVAVALFEEGGMEMVQRDLVKILVGQSPDGDRGQAIDQLLDERQSIVRSWIQFLAMEVLTKRDSRFSPE